MVFGTASEAQVQPLIQETPALGPGGADTRPNSAGGGLESWGGFVGPSLQPHQPPAAPRPLPAALWKLAREDEAGSGVEAVLDLMQILSHPHPTPQGFPKQPQGPGIPVQACSPAGLWSGVPTPRTGGWVSANARCPPPAVGHSDPRFHFSGLLCRPPRDIQDLLKGLYGAVSADKQKTPAGCGRGKKASFKLAKQPGSRQAVVLEVFQHHMQP